MGWRTPVVIVLCGCLISMISFGPRSSLGFFLSPLSNAHGWGREVFAFSAALQLQGQNDSSPTSVYSPGSAGSLSQANGAASRGDALNRASTGQGVGQSS